METIHIFGHLETVQLNGRSYEVESISHKYHEYNCCFKKVKYLYAFKVHRDDGIQASVLNCEVYVNGKRTMVRQITPGDLVTYVTTGRWAMDSVKLYLSEPY